MIVPILSVAENAALRTIYVELVVCGVHVADSQVTTALGKKYAVCRRIAAHVHISLTGRFRTCFDVDRISTFICVYGAKTHSVYCDLVVAVDAKLCRIAINSAAVHLVHCDCIIAGAAENIAVERHHSVHIDGIVTAAVPLTAAGVAV